MGVMLSARCTKFITNDILFIGGSARIRLIRNSE